MSAIWSNISTCRNSFNTHAATYSQTNCLSNSTCKTWFDENTIALRLILTQTKSRWLWKFYPELIKIWRFTCNSYTIFYNTIIRLKTVFDKSSYFKVAWRIVSFLTILKFSLPMYRTKISHSISQIYFDNFYWWKYPLNNVLQMRESMST